MGNGYGSKPDQFEFPQGIFIEPKTQILYVADSGNDRVQKRYPNGEIKTAAGQPNGEGGSTADKLTSPADVFADEYENVYVADLHNERIQYWKKDAKSGETVAGNGNAGDGLSEFRYPSQVVLNSKKNPMVADYQNQRITEWPANYKPKSSTGTIIAVRFSFDIRKK